MAVKPLKISIIGDGGSAARALQQTTRQVGSLRTSLAKPLAAAGFTVGLAATVAATRSALNSAVDSASSINESVSAIRVVYGRGAKQVEAFARTSATSIGEASRATLGYFQTFGTFGAIAKISGKDLAKFSTGLVQLSGDLASFRNTSVEDAAGAISSALAGEIEPLRKYGILLNELVLRKRAVNLGLTKSTKEVLTGEERVLAVQAEVLAQSKLQQGDFARTKTGYANQKRIISGLSEDARSKIGKIFIPTLRLGQRGLISFLTGFRDGKGTGGQFADIVSKIADVAANKALPAIRALVKAGVSFVSGFFRNTGKGGQARQFLGKVTDPIVKLLKFLRSVVGKGLDYAKELLDPLQKLYRRYGPGIIAFFQELWRVLKQSAAQLAPALVQLGKSIGETLGLIGNVAAQQEGGVAGLFKAFGDVLLATIPIVTKLLVILAKLLAIPELQYFIVGVITVVAPLLAWAKALALVTGALKAMQAAMVTNSLLTSIDKALGITATRNLGKSTKAMQQNAKAARALRIQLLLTAIQTKATTAALLIKRGALIAYTVATKVATTAVGVLRGAMLLLAANPVVLVVAAVVALVAAFAIAYTRVDGFRQGVDAFARSIEEFLRNTRTRIGEIVAAPFIGLGRLIASFGAVLRKVASDTVGYFQGLYQTTLSLFSSLAGAVRSAFVSAVRGVTDALTAPFKAIQKLAGGRLGGGKIPALANGGIVRSPTLALIGEAGPEAVVPLGRGFGQSGGNTYNVNVTAGVGDPASIGQSVVAAVRAFERQTGQPAF